jgi:uncharacterized protein YkwD
MKPLPHPVKLHRCFGREEEEMLCPRLVSLATLLLMLLALLAGCSTSTTTNDATPLPEEEKIFALVNEARVSDGLSPLVRVDTLDALALEHSQDMAKTGILSHDGFDARADSIERSLGSSCVGENVAMGYESAKAFVDGWLNSSGHRANIMNPSYRRTGIGYYKSYATQIFCD